MMTLAEQSVARVRDWLAARIEHRHEIARQADVDEKTIRLAMADDWDPRASTLRKLESVIPAIKRKRKPS